MCEKEVSVTNAREYHLNFIHHFHVDLNWLFLVSLWLVVSLSQQGPKTTDRFDSNSDFANKLWLGSLDLKQVYSKRTPVLHKLNVLRSLSAVIIHIVTWRSYNSSWKDHSLASKHSFSFTMQYSLLQETLQLVQSSCSWLQVLGSSGKFTIFGICYLWFLFVNVANVNLLYENKGQEQKTAVFLVSSFFLLFPFSSSCWQPSATILLLCCLYLSNFP